MEQKSKAHWRGLGLKVGIGIAALLAGFLAGYILQRRTVERAEAGRAAAVEQVVQLEQELGVAVLAGRLGAALAEAERGNYERARQLASSFYMDLPNISAVGADAAAVIRELQTQRDDIITLLSRAQPEARQRLALMVTRFYTIADPTVTADATVTPPPPNPP